MKHATGAFFLALAANLVWILFSTLRQSGATPQADALLLVGPCFASLVLYFSYLFSKGRSLTQRDIDSVYYLGFLITLMVLGAAAYQVAQVGSENTSQSGTLVGAIGLKFGLGLLATGFGLFGRITLQSRLASPEDATQAIADYVEGIGKLNDRISTSSTEIERLLDEVLKNASEASKKASQTVISVLSEELTPTVRKLAEEIAELNGVASDLNDGPMKSLREVAEDVSTGFERLGRQVPQVNTGFESLARFATDAATAQSDLAQAAVATTESITGAGEAFKSTAATVKPAVEQVQLLSDSIRKASTIMKKVPDGAERLSTGLLGAVTSLEAISATSAKLVEAIAAYQKTLDAGPLQAFTRGIGAAGAGGEQLSKQLNSLNQAVTRVGTEFSGTLGSNAREIGALATSMTDTSQQLGAAMERLAKAIRDAAREVGAA
jgi:methyl-accepting chemotaxis protein